MFSLDWDVINLFNVFMLSLRFARSINLQLSRVHFNFWLFLLQSEKHDFQKKAWYLRNLVSVDFHMIVFKPFDQVVTNQL